MTRSRAPRALALIGVCAALLCAALLCLGPLAGAQAASRTSPQSAATAAPAQESAGLEQCVTSVTQTERSATFTGEMTAVAGTAKMAMRVDVQEKLPGELGFHTLTFPGLGVWRSSDPKVKVYKYLKQVTNLSAPAVYRALVRFRWLSAKGHLIRRAEHLTPKCDEPAAPASRRTSASEAPPPATSSSSPPV